MPNTFTSVQDEIDATAATVYTAPADTVSIILGCRVANKTAGSVTASITLKRGAVVTELIGTDCPIPVASAVEAASGGKIVLEAGDLLQAAGSAAACADITVSVLEVT